MTSFGTGFRQNAFFPGTPQTKLLRNCFTETITEVSEFDSFICLS